MKRLASLFCAAGLLSSATSASAISFYTEPFHHSTVPGVNYVVDFESGAPTTGFAIYETVVPAVGSTEAFAIWNNITGSNPVGMHNSTNHLAVGAGNGFAPREDGIWDAPDAVMQIRLAHLTDYFGLEWGTMDFYNDLLFYNGDHLVGLFTGNSTLLDGVASNVPHGTIFISHAPHATAQAFVNFFSEGVDDMFDRIVMRSSQAFESDMHSFRLPVNDNEIPEPASMMLLGLGALGAIRARRKLARSDA